MNLLAEEVIHDYGALEVGYSLARTLLWAVLLLVGLLDTYSSCIGWQGLVDPLSLLLAERFCSTDIYSDSRISRTR